MERLKTATSQSEQRPSNFETNESFGTDREVEKKFNERVAHQERVQNLRSAINIASTSNPNEYQDAIKQSLENKLSIQKGQQRLL